MEDDGFNERIYRAWAHSIESNLPKLNDPAFRQYNTIVNTQYYVHNQEYFVECSVDVVKTYKAYCTIPRSYIDFSNLNKIEESMSSLSADLSRQILNKHYIEVNGVKYYPKDEGE